MLTLAQQLEQLAGLGILVIGLGLAALSALAWSRERESRLLLVAGAYALFAIHGAVLFLEYTLLVSGWLPAGQVELLEHGSSVLILVGLLAFFVAVVRE